MHPLQSHVCAAHLAVDRPAVEPAREAVSPPCRTGDMPVSASSYPNEHYLFSLLIHVGTRQFGLSADIGAAHCNSSAAESGGSLMGRIK